MLTWFIIPIFVTQFVFGEEKINPLSQGFGTNLSCLVKIKFTFWIVLGFSRNFRSKFGIFLNLSDNIYRLDRNHSDQSLESFIEALTVYS